MMQTTSAQSQVYSSKSTARSPASSRTAHMEQVFQAVARQQHDPPPDVVLPPRSSAVLSTYSTDQQSQRDRHVRMIAEKGRMGWQKATGYGRRSLVETAIGRYKHLIGSTLGARQ